MKTQIPVNLLKENKIKNEEEKYLVANGSAKFCRLVDRFRFRFPVHHSSEFRSSAPSRRHFILATNLELISNIN